MENPFVAIEERLTNIESLLTEFKMRQEPIPMEPLTEQPISQKDATEFLGKSRQTLIMWRRRGIIKAHILGGRVYFLKSELLAALTKNK